MIDIVSVGNDIGILDTQVPKATNVLSVQLGSLEYAQDLGIDLAYFLQEDFVFQNESFKAYLIERLAAQGINVSGVMETVESLYQQLTFEVGRDEPTGLVAG